MRRKIGIACIVLGVFCLISSAGCVLYNRMEAESAEVSSQAILQEVQLKIGQSVQETAENNETTPEGKTPALEVPEDCIGVLSIPVLELELPVLSDWSYEKFRKAPCRYYGSCEEADFVIAAHNYPSHFGRLVQLQPKDLVLFTDVSGNNHCYEVVLLETLQPEATKEMITSGFDLSLYTCTPGGGSRVTVRCKKISL